MADPSMTVNWDGYEIYHPGVRAPVATLPRAEARHAYEKAMAEKSARIEMLRRLLKANGVELNGSQEAVQGLNDWFNANIEPDPYGPGRLTPAWYSVAHDVAIFLGETIIQRCPGLRWEFFTREKKSVSYQRHVIVGFTQVPNPNHNLDLALMVVGYGHALIANRGSVARQGKVVVRGVEIDVDDSVRRQLPLKLPADRFWQWVELAMSEA